MAGKKGRLEEKSLKTKTDDNWYGGKKVFIPKSVEVKKTPGTPMSTILKLISKNEVAKNTRKYTQII